jgi:hypothetical protein
MRNDMLVLVGSVLIVACGGSADAPGEGLPEGHPEMATLPGVGVGSQENQGRAGTVLETFDSGGYSYARLATNEGEVWIAGPVTALEVGQTISLYGAALMSDFVSTSLDRTFERIYFVGRFQLGDTLPEDLSQSGIRGVALEVLQGAGFTYVRVRVGKNSVWIAGPKTEVEVGQTVLWAGGTAMGEFRSPTLDRTFENILFVPRMQTEGG